MKKNIFLFAIPLTILVVMSACNKVLQNDYYMGLDTNDQFSTPERIDLAAVGLYDALQNPEFLGGRALIYVDIRSNDVNVTQYFGNMSLFTTLLSNDDINGKAWLGGYETIFACNTFIASLTPKVDVVGQGTANSYFAEARFVRSLVYFYMLNFWGQQYCATNNGLGVPLVLEAADAGSAFTQLPPRATIDQCYTQIIEDLKFAEANLPATRAGNYSTLSRANKASARALLSRVYLYRGNNDSAVMYADRVITPTDGTKTYGLDSNLATGVFQTPDPSGSNEPIFFVAMKDTDNPNTNNALGQHYGYDQRADISISLDYIKSLDTSLDKRFKNLIIFNEGNFYTQKYNVLANGSWVPVIRYPEILLNKAEAIVKQNLGGGADPTALANLNAVRRRSGLADTTIATTNQELLAAILLERWRELAFEGHASFDAFRNRKGIPARGTIAAIDFPNDKFALPIPLSDMQKNPNLVQNSTY